jgi:hypothetical protein
MFKRKALQGVLLNLTDHCVQLARLGRLDERPLLVDHFTELPVSDEDAIIRWLRENIPNHVHGMLPGYCGFHPGERLFLREMINSRRLDEAGYVPGLVAEFAKVPNVKEWHVDALHTVDGLSLTDESTQRAALLLGLPWTAVREAQHRLRKWGIRPRRLEIGSIALLGALSRHLSLNAYPHAVVVCEIGQTQTRIYLLGKDGVHTPSPLPYGLLSIEEAAMKELSAPDVATALRQLEEPTESLRTHSRRLVRMLSRHLRPAVDYFEMQTGQRIGALFCGHLPARLAWLEESLSASVDLELFPLDYAAWLPAVGLQTGDTLPPGPSWFQPLSLVAELAPAPAPAPVAHAQKP